MAQGSIYFKSLYFESFYFNSSVSGFYHSLPAVKASALGDMSFPASLPFGAKFFIPEALLNKALHLALPQWVARHEKGGGMAQ